MKIHLHIFFRRIGPKKYLRYKAVCEETGFHHESQRAGDAIAEVAIRNFRRGLGSDRLDDYELTDDRVVSITTGRAA